MKSKTVSIFTFLDGIVVKFMNFVVILTNVAIALMICATVVLRYGFETDLYAIDEIETLLAFWLYFIGAAYASYSKRQVTADIVVQYVKNKKVVKLISSFSSLVACLICCVFTKFSIDLLVFAIDKSQKSLLWRIPMSYTYIAITIGFVLMTIYSFRDVVNTIKS